MKLIIGFLFIGFVVLAAFVLALCGGVCLAVFDTACAAFDDSLKSGEFD